MRRLTAIAASLVSILCALIATPAYAEDVFETILVPWKYSEYANAEELDEYDKEYRILYDDDDVHTPQARGCYSGNVTKNIGHDDDTFYEPYSYKIEEGHVIDIVVDFDREVEFQEMIYGSRTDGGNLKGFATEFNVYTSQSDDDSANDWVKVAHGTGTQTRSLCSFDVCPSGETVTAHRVKFEFVSSYNNYPSCRCLRFYKEDPHEHDVEKIWSDYTQTSFAEGISNEDVKEMLKGLEDSPSYEITYEPYLQRVRDVLAGKVEFDETLVRKNQEIGQADVSSPDFLRIGDLAGYARNTMKFPNGGTNRQVTGIWYPSNTQAHIWVYQEKPTDKLPKVSFAQPYGYWASWRADGVQLHAGENIITIPNRKTIDYKTYDIIAGMAMYIENPYTEQEQQGEVKIYFEGGRHFPVYRLGADINAYMEELRSHADRVREDHLSEMDVTELVSGHVMMTVQATRADEIYGAKGHNAEQNLKEWDKTIERCLQFEGIPMTQEEEHNFDVSDEFQVKYDVKNKFLNENFRVSQVWDLGWMFTAGEHIGVYDDPSAQDVLIDCLDKYGNSNIGPNWGLIHEWGHSVDIPARSIQETTNNMAPYYESTFYQEFRRNEEDIVRANRMALPNYENGTMQAENRYNFMPFWLVESYFPGWWGKLSNMYRLVPQTENWGYATENGKLVDKLTKSERMVLYASIAAKYDLRYWFDKWGLQIDTNQAKYEKAHETDSFKSVWEKHKNSISETYEDFTANNPLPLWYLDRDEYLKVANAENGAKSLHIYTDESQKPELLALRHGTKTVTKEVNGQKQSETYDVVNITIKKSFDPAHLCYVVQSKKLDEPEAAWTNAGYTHGGVFTDERKLKPEDYEGLEFRVAAMDRSLHQGPCSETIQFEDAQPNIEVVTHVWTKNGLVQADAPSEAEKALGEWSESEKIEKFQTLEAAIDCAIKNEGTDGYGLIRLLDNVMASGVQIPANEKIRIEVASSEATLGRGSEDYIFDIGQNAELSLVSSDEHKLVVDGYLAEGNKAGIVLNSNNGVLRANGVTFKNFVNAGQNNEGQGGAISVATSYAKAGIFNCTFENNRALDGGALASRGTVTIKDSIFRKNTATDEGGAIRNHNGGIVYAVNDTFEDNTGVYAGGISATGFTLLSSCDLHGNVGKYGGAIDARLGSARQLVVTGAENGEPTKIYDNTALVGSAIRSGDAGSMFINKAEISDNEGNETLIQLDAGKLVLSADINDLSAVNGNVRNGSLKDIDNTPISNYICQTAQAPIINGSFGDGGNAYPTVSHVWYDGQLDFRVDDLGRSQPILATENLEQPNNFSEKVLLTEEPTLVLEHHQSEEPTDVDGIYVQRGGTVTLETDGGTVKSGNIEGYTSGVVTYLPTDVVKTGFSFVGWFPTEARTGNSVRFIPADQQGNVTYYAKWSQGNYWINYRPNGGEMPEDTQWHRTIEEGVSLRTPIRADYEFLGWYPDSEFKKAEMTSIAAGIEGDVQIFAKYNHHKNGGTKTVLQPATCTSEGTEVWTYKCVDCDEPMETEVKTIPAKGHSWNGWVEVETPACGGKKFSTRTCRNCGFVETNISADELATQEHQWGEAERAKEPTCTEAGSLVYTCSTCGAKKSEPIAPLGHNFEGQQQELDEKSTATCALPGVVDIYQTCKTCGQRFLTGANNTDPLGHTWKLTYEAPNDETPAPAADDNGWVVKSERSCETGCGQIRYRTCEVCGFVETVEDEFDHVWNTVATIDKEATCTSAGESSIHCMECGARKEVAEIPVLPHDFSDPNSPTCKYCSEKNVNYKDPTVEPPKEEHQHTWSSTWAASPEATCTTPGVKYKYCTDPTCAAKDEDSITVIEPLGHDFGENNELEECSRCHEKNESYVHPHVHTLGEWEDSIAPSCDVAGLRVKHCTECGDEVEREIIPALGHDFKEGICIRCEKPYENEEHEHEYSNEWVVDLASTCTVDGIQSHHCTICNAETDAEAIPALGHDFGENEQVCLRDGCGQENPDYVAPHEHVAKEETEVEVLPTCVNYGVDKVFCALCGEVIEEKPVEPTGHNFGQDGLSKYCLVVSCGASNPAVEHLEEEPLHMGLSSTSVSQGEPITLTLSVPANETRDVVFSNDILFAYTNVENGTLSTDTEQVLSIPASDTERVVSVTFLTRPNTALGKQEGKVRSANSESAFEFSVTPATKSFTSEELEVPEGLSKHIVDVKDRFTIAKKVSPQESLSYVYDEFSPEFPLTVGAEFSSEYRDGHIVLTNQSQDATGYVVFSYDADFSYLFENDHHIDGLAERVHYAFGDDLYVRSPEVLPKPESINEGFSIETFTPGSEFTYCAKIQPGDSINWVGGTHPENFIRDVRFYDTGTVVMEQIDAVTTDGWASQNYRNVADGDAGYVVFSMKLPINIELGEHELTLRVAGKNVVLNVVSGAAQVPDTPPEYHEHADIRLAYAAWLQDNDFDLNPEFWEEESWARFVEAQKELDEAIDDTTLSDSDVASAFTKVKDVFGALSPILASAEAKQALSEELADAEALYADLHGEGNWTALKEAITEANKALSINDLTLRDLRAVLRRLNGTRMSVSQGEVVQPDKTKLEELVNEVGELDLSLYTPESVENLQEALSGAQAALASPAATEDHINLSYSELLEAKNALVPLPAAHGDDIEIPSDTGGEQADDGEGNPEDVSGSLLQRRIGDGQEQQQQLDEENDLQSRTGNEEERQAGVNNSDEQKVANNGDVSKQQVDKENTQAGEQNQSNANANAEQVQQTNNASSAAEVIDTSTTPIYVDTPATTTGVMRATSSVTYKLADTGTPAVVLPSLLVGIAAGVAFVIKYKRKQR